MAEGRKWVKNREKKAKCTPCISRNITTMKFWGKVMNREYAILARGKFRQKIGNSAQKGRGVEDLSKNEAASEG